jgi:dTDP-4-dehydrorhamnose reductase
MGKKLLIFGGTGFVGGHIAQMAHDAGWDVMIAGSRAVPAAGAITRRSADIGGAMAVHLLMSEFRPDIVVNTAALADIDRAERERDIAWRVNADGAANVAHACREAGARCIYYSTDVVFDGTQPSYAEDDPPRPRTTTGYLLAEEARNAERLS